VTFHIFPAGSDDRKHRRGLYKRFSNAKTI
jgi:hypothetical protein